VKPLVVFAIVFRRICMNKALLLSLSIVVAACAGTVPPPPTPDPAKSVAVVMPSKEEMMEAWKIASTPGENHAALRPYLGKWKTTTKTWGDPATPPEVSKGKATFTSLYGGRFVAQEYQGKFMGQPFFGRGVLGFDNVKKEFVSDWVDSASTAVMLSSGARDATGAIVTKAEMECPVMKKSMMVRQVMTPVKDGRFTYEMFGSDPSGNEFKMLEVTYSR
jgi:Protein of unknown function (DUF1579)